MTNIWPKTLMMSINPRPYESSRMSRHPAMETTICITSHITSHLSFLSRQKYSSPLGSATASLSGSHGLPCSLSRLIPTDLNAGNVSWSSYCIPIKSSLIPAAASCPSAWKQRMMCWSRMKPNLAARMIILALPFLWSVAAREHGHISSFSIQNFNASKKLG